MDEKYWKNLEKLFVHNVYDEISPYYDDDVFASTNIEKNQTIYTEAQNEQHQEEKQQTNHYKARSVTFSHHNAAWRKVKKFLLELEPHSLVADIGKLKNPAQIILF